MRPPLRRLMFFLWLGRYVKLHGPIGQWSDTGFCCAPTRLGVFVAKCLRIHPIPVEWDTSIVGDK